MTLLTLMRKLIYGTDRLLGKALLRFLSALCMVGGLWAVLSAGSAMRRQFSWALLFPLLAGAGFLAGGVWLWRSKKRLSDFDWTGV